MARPNIWPSSAFIVCPLRIDFPPITLLEAGELRREDVFRSRTLCSSDSPDPLDSTLPATGSRQHPIFTRHTSHSSPPLQHKTRQLCNQPRAARHLYATCCLGAPGRSVPRQYGTGSSGLLHQSHVKMLCRWPQGDHRRHRKEWKDRAETGCYVQ